MLDAALTVLVICAVLATVSLLAAMNQPHVTAMVASY